MSHVAHTSAEGAAHTSAEGLQLSWGGPRGVTGVEKIPCLLFNYVPYTILYGFQLFFGIFFRTPLPSPGAPPAPPPPPGGGGGRGHPRGRAVGCEKNFRKKAGIRLKSYREHN